MYLWIRCAFYSTLDVHLYVHGKVHITLNRACSRPSSKSPQLSCLPASCGLQWELEFFWFVLKIYGITGVQIRVPISPNIFLSFFGIPSQTHGINSMTTYLCFSRLGNHDEFDMENANFFFKLSYKEGLGCEDAAEQRRWRQSNITSSWLNVTIKISYRISTPTPCTIN